MRSPTEPRVIAALDYASVDDARAFIKRIEGAPCTLKVGLELFTSAGPDFVRELCLSGWSVFLDLKVHDIPHTVARTTEQAAKLGVRFLTVHLLGGRKVVEAATSAAGPNLKILGVSVLTAHSTADWAEIAKSIGTAGPVPAIAQSVSGLISAVPGLLNHGVVCSAHEVSTIKQQWPTLYAVTPGVRLKGEPVRDQSRVVTPETAFMAGSDAIVLGQTLRSAQDPRALILSLA